MAFEIYLLDEVLLQNHHKASCPANHLKLEIVALKMFGLVSQIM